MSMIVYDGNIQSYLYIIILYYSYLAIDGIIQMILTRVGISSYP